MHTTTRLLGWTKWFPLAGLIACAAGAQDSMPPAGDVPLWDGASPTVVEPGTTDPAVTGTGGVGGAVGTPTTTSMTNGPADDPLLDPGFAGSGGLIDDPTDPTGAAGSGGDTTPVIGTGACCADGDCLCHGPDPAQLTSSNGPYATSSYTVAEGKVFYPTDGEPPYAGIAIVPGFINSGPEMEPWGPFYASHGFVMIAVNTLGSDFPDIRATKLLAGVARLKSENESASSPIYGLLADRYGTTGYSMGGGGTTIASGQDASLRTSIGLAAWGPVTNGVTVPTLLLCGSSDGTAPCSMSQGAYDGLSASTPKMIISIAGATHFSWFSPTGAGGGTSGAYALAFQKVFLDGDERWKPLLTQPPSNGTATTNIQ